LYYCIAIKYVQIKSNQIKSFAVLEHQEEQEEDLETIWGQFKTVFTQTAENTRQKTKGDEGLDVRDHSKEN
jgi:hypothetical protein